MVLKVSAASLTTLQRFKSLSVFGVHWRDRLRDRLHHRFHDRFHAPV